MASMVVVVVIRNNSNGRTTRLCLPHSTRCTARSSLIVPDRCGSSIRNAQERRRRYVYVSARPIRRCFLIAASYADRG